MAVMRWRTALMLLPLMLLLVGVLNILLLHSLSSSLFPEHDSSTAAAAVRHRRRHRLARMQFARNGGGDGRGVSAGEWADERDEESAGQALRAAASTGNAVIYPATPGDRTTGALTLVLRERGLQPEFCRQNLRRCIAEQSNGKTDLVWLKKEGNVGEIPEQSLKGAAAVNSLGVGWKVWSRRSLCIALNLNRRALKNQPAQAAQMSWYPDCYTLPLKPAQAARLRDEPVPGSDMWIVHGSSAAASSIFSSGEEAAGVSGAGVMQRYISPPLTIQGYKFSLLLYVVVTSVSPLRAWLYRDGHVMLASQPYTERVEEEDWQSPHVTRLDAHAEKVQHIRGRSGLLQHLASSEIAIDKVWDSIADAVGLAVLSAATYITPKSATGAEEADRPGSASPQRFKLLAAHLVLDSSLKPWVTKLDPSPSLQLHAQSSTGSGSGWAARRGRVRDGEAGGGLAGRGGAGDPQKTLAQSIIDYEHDFTQWLFEDDVHHVNRELEDRKVRRSRIGHLRRRRRLRREAAAAGGGVDASGASSRLLLSLPHQGHMHISARPAVATSREHGAGAAGDAEVSPRGRGRIWASLGLDSPSLSPHSPVPFFLSFLPFPPPSLSSPSSPLLFSSSPLPFPFLLSSPPPPLNLLFSCPHLATYLPLSPPVSPPC